MFKELLNKMKLFKKFCVAVAIGNMYTPYVRAEMKRYEEEQKRQQAEEEAKRVYAKGGVIEPLAQRFELDNDEKIFFLDEWEKNNPALNIDFESFARSIEQSAVSVQDLADAMRGLARQAEAKEAERIKRQSTNNWRKMHGLPMRRKAGRKKW